MKFKFRKIMREDGGVELRLNLLFSVDDVLGIERINDDQNATFDNLRAGGADHVLLSARILAHVASLWGERNVPGMKPHLREMLARKAGYAARPARKKRKRR